MLPKGVRSDFAGLRVGCLLQAANLAMNVRAVFLCLLDQVNVVPLKNPVPVYFHFL